MVLKAKEIRQMNSEERGKKLKELKEELMHERGVSAMGGSSPSPGKIRQIRQTIARILTIMKEEGEHK
jgi:large subunit ribosomal protein L29